MDIKRCTKCGLEKSVDEFCKCKDTADGLQRWCRECQRVAKRRWDKDNAEHRATYKAQYNTEHKQEVLDYSRRYRKEHLEKCREYDRRHYREIRERKKAYNEQYHAEYYQRNKAYVVQCIKRYQQVNTDKVVFYRQKNLAKRRAAMDIKNTLTLFQWESVICFFEHRCAYCGKDVNLTQDHVIPLTKGGTHTQYNVIPACGSCNSSKNNKEMQAWYQKQPFFSPDRYSRIITHTSNR